MYHIHLASPRFVSLSSSTGSSAFHVVSSSHPQISCSFSSSCPQRRKRWEVREEKEEGWGWKKSHNVVSYEAASSILFLSLYLRAYLVFSILACKTDADDAISWVHRNAEAHASTRIRSSSLVNGGCKKSTDRAHMWLRGGTASALLDIFSLRHWLLLCAQKISVCACTRLETCELSRAGGATNSSYRPTWGARGRTLRANPRRARSSTRLNQAPRDKSPRALF